MELCSWTLALNAHRGLDLDAAVCSPTSAPTTSADHGNLRNYMAGGSWRMFRDLRVRPASPEAGGDRECRRPARTRLRRDLAPGVRALTYARGAARQEPLPRGRVWASRIVHAATGTWFRVHALAARPLACHTPAARRLQRLQRAGGAGLRGGAGVRLARRAGRARRPADTRRPAASRLSRRAAAAALPSSSTTPTPREPPRPPCPAAHARWPSGRVHAVFGCGGDCRWAASGR